MAEMVEKRLEVTWTTSHRIMVPAGTTTPRTWGGVMALVEADPELGDVHSGAAEVSDWELS